MAGADYCSCLCYSHCHCHLCGRSNFYTEKTTNMEDEKQSYISVGTLSSMFLYGTGLTEGFSVLMSFLLLLLLFVVNRMIL